MKLDLSKIIDLASELKDSLPATVSVAMTAKEFKAIKHLLSNFDYVQIWFKPNFLYVRISQQDFKNLKNLIRENFYAQ